MPAAIDNQGLAIQLQRQIEAARSYANNVQVGSSADVLTNAERALIASHSFLRLEAGQKHISNADKQEVRYLQQKLQAAIDDKVIQQVDQKLAARFHEEKKKA